MWLTSARCIAFDSIPGYVQYLPHHVEMNLRGLMLAFRHLLEGNADPAARDATGKMWSLAAGAALGVFAEPMLPSLADTSGLSRGAIAAEPLLYAPSCASAPQGTECRVFLQLFEQHNSTIHSKLRHQQPLQNADPDSFRAWLRAAHAAAGMVQLLYQAFIYNEYLALYDNQKGERGVMSFATPQTGLYQRTSQ
jgi:hypothetical protein